MLNLPLASVYRRPKGIPKPSRDAVCGVNNHFQGLTISTSHFGPNRPWFEPDIAQCDLKSDREAFYVAHQAVGDSHINLSLDLSGLAGLPHLVALASEAILEGRVTGIILCCMGDGHGQPNTDPGSLGQDWLMANFSAIYAAFRAAPISDHFLSDHIIFVPGYDGVIPDWQPPSSVDRFLLHAREVLDAGGSGYLGLELSSGYCVWGDEHAIEGNNWSTPAGKAVDVILQEGPIYMGPPEPCPPGPPQDRWSQVYQIAGRMIKPFYPVPGQHDDPNPPYLLAGGTPRGPFYYVFWEFDTYEWTLPWRHGSGGMPVEQVEQHRQALYDMGCKFVG